MKPDEISPEWLARMRDAQEITHAQIAGRAYPRKPYGTEVADPRPRCRDCAVEIGQLHVPSCCVERCAACDGQALSCHCHEAGEKPVQ